MNFENCVSQDRANNMPPITLEQAKSLTMGTTLYDRFLANANGSPWRWKVNGQVKTWKRDSTRVRVPVKRGLRDFTYVTESSLPTVSLSNGD